MESLPYIRDSIRSIIIEAPGSIANLGPGFDILAMAIEGLRDRVKLSITPGKGRIRIKVEGYEVPEDEGNVAYSILKKIINEYNLWDIDFSVEITKGVPVSAGLGSSGATSAAVAYGLSVLLGLGLSQRELLKLAGVGEAHVAGAPHYDNVAASLFGGIVIVDPVELVVHVIKPKVEFWVGIIVPEARVKHSKTREARGILPRVIDLHLHVKQSASLAKLIHALHVGDLVTLGEAISSDYIVEPHRAKLVKEYWSIKEIALRDGALGFNIAGAGPSVFLIHRTKTGAIRTCKRIVEYLQSTGIKASFYVARVSEKGARIIG